MNVSDFLDMIDERSFRAIVIHTRGGRDYPVTDPANVWVPKAYSTTACVAVPGRGITLLDIDSIEGVRFEHDSPIHGAGMIHGDYPPPPRALGTPHSRSAVDQ